MSNFSYPKKWPCGTKCHKEGLLLLLGGESKKHLRKCLTKCLRECPTKCFGSRVVTLSSSYTLRGFHHLRALVCHDYVQIMAINRQQSPSPSKLQYTQKYKYYQLLQKYKYYQISKKIQIQTLREVEGQRDLLPAQVQCLHLFRLSICNDGPDVFSAMNGYRIRDTRGKQNC